MKKLAVVVALIAFIGMIDAFYISLKAGGPVTCHVTQGCNDVLTSRFSRIGGIPISWLGLAFYLSVFSCAVFEASGSAGTLRLIFWPAAAAFVVSLGLTGVQAFVLEAYCEYCLLSAGLVTIIFALNLVPKWSGGLET